MDKCRACLFLGDDMIPFTEELITNYNLLTTLSVSMFDNFPKSVCRPCRDKVNCFMDFKQTCLKSENTLKDIKIEKEERVIDDQKCNEDNGEFILEIEPKEEFSVSYSEEEPFNIFSDFEYEMSSIKEENFGTRIQLKKRRTTSAKSSVLTKKKRSYQRRNHKSETIYSEELACGLCKKTFTDKSLWSTHLDAHKSDKSCSLCFDQFSTWPQLLSHRMIHTKECVCHVCSKKCMTLAALESHYLKLHYEGQNRHIQCKECSRKFENLRKLSRHVNYAHSKRMFICDHCSKVCNSKSQMKAHVVVHNKNKNFVCDMCDFACRYRQGLVNHKITHSKNKVICRKCCKPFVNKEKYDGHDCKAKNIICPTCGKVFNTTSKYSRHTRVHNDKRTHKCDRCPALYKTAAALKVHKDRHDGNRTKQCEYCKAKFYSQNVLIKHRRVHTGEKPYVCRICKKGFTGGNNLKVHMKVHGEYLVVKKCKEEDIDNLTLT